MVKSAKFSRCFHETFFFLIFALRNVHGLAQWYGLMKESRSSNIKNTEQHNQYYAAVMRCDTYKSSYCLRFVGQTPEMYLNTVKGAYLKK